MKENGGLCNWINLATTMKANGNYLYPTYYRLLDSQTKEGKGILMSGKTGDIYEGWWKSNKQNGLGRYIWGDDGACYEG